MMNNDARALQDAKIDVKLKLSALWAAMMFLYIYADLLSLFKPGQIDEIREGFMGPLQATQGSLLSASILMIIPAVMVFLSLTLKAHFNRWTNFALGILYTFVNIGNLIGESWAYYILFGAVEIIMTLLIVGYAWKWPKPETSWEKTSKTD